MKKVIMIAAVAALTAVSCAKDRTCTCTQTNSANSTSTTNTVTLVNNTKGQAKANCITTKQTATNGTVYTNTCELK